MRIVGNGFLARHLRGIAYHHPDVVALAAGVSGTGDTPAADFTREAELVAAVVERCRQSGRTLLFFSTASAGVYGADRPGREDDPPVARSAYGAHKLGLERRVTESGIRYLVLRVSHLAGPGQPPHQLLPTLVRSLRQGGITIQRAATRDLIDVGDAVMLIDALLDKGVRDEIVNVASGTAVPAERIVDHLEARLGTAARREYRDTGTAHQVCVDKLLSLVPETGRPDFGPDYYRRALDGFLTTVV